MSENVTKLVVRLSPEGQRITLKGRVAWAVHELLKAGATRCTPIDNPCPRWSDYVFKAKRAGLDIETVTENHCGSFSGRHARYQVRSHLEVLEIERAGGR